MSPSIAYDIKTGVGEVRDNDIIVFLNRIYTRLGQWRHLEDSDYFLKERLTSLRENDVLQSGPYGKCSNICLSIIDNLFVEFYLFYPID